MPNNHLPSVIYMHLKHILILTSFLQVIVPIMGQKIKMLLKARQQKGKSTPKSTFEIQVKIL